MVLGIVELVFIYFLIYLVDIGRCTVFVFTLFLVYWGGDSMIGYIDELFTVYSV